MYYYLQIIVFSGVFIWNIGNLLQILLDLVHFYKKPTLTLTIRRIHPLFIKYRKNKPLGIYERYVLERELKKYISYGGSIDYFTSGVT